MKFLILLCVISASYAVPLKQPSTDPFNLPASKYKLNVRDNNPVSPTGNPFGRGINQLQAQHPTDDSHYTQQEGLTKDGYAKIINHDQKIHHNGDYQYIFKTDNGISAHEVGKLKIFSDEDAGSEAQGQYSYTAPDGQVITVQYVANELGFQPVGDHLPTPPPVPDHVVRLLAYLAKEEQAAAEKSGKRF